MEDNVRPNAMPAKEIAFSKVIKAGRRIYYVDVKLNRKDEMYLSITESKKIVTGEGDDSLVNFEKHKIFIYKEDFDKLREAIGEAIAFVEERQGKAEPRKDEDADEIKFDIDF